MYHPDRQSTEEQKERAHDVFAKKSEAFGLLLPILDYQRLHRIEEPLLEINHNQIRLILPPRLHELLVMHLLLDFPMDSPTCFWVALAVVVGVEKSPKRDLLPEIEQQQHPPSLNRPI